MESYFTISKDGITRLRDEGKTMKRTKTSTRNNRDTGNASSKESLSKLSLSSSSSSSSNSQSLPSEILDKKQKMTQIQMGQTRRSNIQDWAGFSFVSDATDEAVQSQLNLIKLRSALDPTHFYRKGTGVAGKKNNGGGEAFQIGTIVDSPYDGYHNRVPNKERGSKSWTSVLLRDEKIKSSIKNRLAKVYANHKGFGKGSYKKKVLKQKKLQ